MTVHRANASSLRFESLDTTRLAWAFGLSVALHLFIWGTYSIGQHYHLWEKLHLPAWLQKLTQSLGKTAKKEDQPVFRETEPPLMFVNVNPAVATAEAPKNAKYYSSQNSKAANPDPERDSTDPKISGNQEFVPKTEDAERNKISKLQPALPAEDPQPEEHASTKTKLTPGDLTLAKPELNPRTDTGNAEKPRPRRLSEVVKNQPSRPPGQKMKQAGGVKAKLDFASLDAKATPFGAYDAMFIEAVSQRWFDLLDARDYASDARGHVQLEFRLHHDGRITDMRVLEKNVTETLSLLCQKAVLDPAPFERWPTEMRQRNNGDVRTIRFIFYYY